MCFDLMSREHVAGVKDNADTYNAVDKISESRTVFSSLHRSEFYKQRLRTNRGDEETVSTHHQHDHRSRESGIQLVHFLRGEWRMPWLVVDKYIVEDQKKYLR